MLFFPSQNEKKYIFPDRPRVLEITVLGDGNQHIFKSGLTCRFTDKYRLRTAAE